MFFRRERPKTLTFDDHMANARSAGFKTEPAAGGGTRIERDGVACVVEPGIEEVPRVIERPGIVMGKEIGTLTDGGSFVGPDGTAASFFQSDVANVLPASFQGKRYLEYRVTLDAKVG